MNNRFKGWADDYQIFENLIDENDKKIQIVISDLVKDYIDKDDSTVFDAGCGTGNTAIGLLNVAPNLIITLNDFDSAMIDIAKDRLKSYRNCLFREGDVIDVLQNEQNFDVLVTVLTIHNIAKDRRKELLKIVFDKLGENGLYINGDKMVDEKRVDEYTEKYNARIDHLAVLKGISRDDLCEKWTKHEKEDFSNLDTIYEHMEELAEAGFVNIKLERQMGLYSIVSARKP
ncbi:MAG: class I SAM-dependent methyltransferase [Candidatus Berkelbacteria bacterium]